MIVNKHDDVPTINETNPTGRFQGKLMLEPAHMTIKRAGNKAYDGALKI